MTWHEHAGKLERAWHFADFSAAWGFASRVALVCEQQGHHADIAVGWGYVRVSTSTHDAGNKVTEKDWALAKVVDGLGA